MSTATLELDQVERDGQLAVSLPCNYDVPTVLRRSTILASFPNLLRTVVRILDNDTIAGLTQAEVDRLFPLLQHMLSVSAGVIDEYGKYPWLMRSVADRVWGWKGTRRDLERLNDVVEALAWSADSELREFTKAAVREFQHSA